MESSTADIGLTIAQYLLPVLLAALGYATTRLAAWLNAKTKNQGVMAMLARLTEGAYVVVRSVEQKTVAAIKAGRDPSSPGGVKLTPEEIKIVEDAALAALKEYWGVAGLDELGKVLGLDAGAVTNLLKGHIEAAVHDLPKATVDPTHPPQSPQD